MYTKEQLKEHLRLMGLKPTDAVMIHSSMKSIGEVEGRADTVLDALMEYFSEGLLMLPTHTWGTVNAGHPVFDPETEPACVGLLPNLFMKRPGVLRSLHPTHSMGVYGQNAAEYIRGEENATTPCPIGGAWYRLKEIGAKILLLGVTHINNTFIHAIDEVFDVPGRLVDKPITLSVKMPDGSLLPRTYYPHEGHVSMEFDKLRTAYEELGAARDVRFGDASCILCDAKGIFDVTSKVYRHDPLCFTSLDVIPEEWWRA
ncbi:MAG: AAC(3) family N-acetyltransferase [Clostridia bacterium]|nr:AAC(3) family N-acetyltransferase [Clostridia bacterium]